MPEPTFLYTERMTAPQEVEIKFLVSNVAALEQNLREAGFSQLTPPTHEMNTLYDRNGGELRRRGELLRLRKYGDHWKLTHKAKSLVGGRHKSRAEQETAIENGEAMHDILISLGLEPLFTYEKFRAEWSDGHGEVVLDLTPIGNLAEIEGAPAWIDLTAQKLGVVEQKYITKSYAVLFNDWKREHKHNAENMTFAECGVPRPL